MNLELSTAEIVEGVNELRRLEDEVNNILRKFKSHNRCNTATLIGDWYAKSVFYDGIPNGKTTLGSIYLPYILYNRICNYYNIHGAGVREIDLCMIHRDYTGITNYKGVGKKSKQYLTKVLSLAGLPVVE